MSRMSQVNADRRNLRNDLVASGSVIEMRYQDDKKAMSLRASKMLHVLVKWAGGRLCEHVKHTIPLSSFYEISMLTHREIENIAQELVTTGIKVKCNGKVTHGAILDFAENSVDETGNLIFRFSEALVNVFKADDRWSILSRNIVMGFESRYALRLFEMLSLRRGLGRKTERFELLDLRSRLGVEQDKLKTYDHLRSKCLEPAVRECSEVMNMAVEFKPIRQGRPIVAVELSWNDPLAVPSDDKAVVSDDEHEARSAPHDVSAASAAAASAPVEPAPEWATAARDIADPVKPRFAFPREGSIRDLHPWHEIAETHCPGYDMNLAASGFRSLAGCKQGGFEPKGPDLEARFEAYCKTKAFATASARARQAGSKNKGSRRVSG